MPRFDPQMFRDGSGRRRGLLELAPFVAFFVAIWLKVSYFNFPPRRAVEVDWNGWRPLEAIQAGAASFAILLLLLSPLLLLAPRTRYLVLLGLNAAVTLLVISDVVHFRFYGDVMSVTAAGAAGQISLVLDSIAALLDPWDLLLVADLALAAALYAPYARLARGVEPLPLPARRRAAARMAVAAVVVIVAVPARIVVLDRGDTFRFGYFRFFGVRKIGLLNYHVYEAGKQSIASLRKYTVSAEEKQEALEFLEAWSDSAQVPSHLFGWAEGRNVILVMAEALQDFPLDLRIEGQEVTPNLNRFAARSLRFTNFFGQTWEGTTSDGEFTSLQSLHPLPTGSVPVRYASNYFRGIPRVLGEHGYATLSAHAYYGDLWRMREMHPALGFQESRFLESFEVHEDRKIAGAPPDEDFFAQSLPWLEDLPEPFMAYLMTMSTHHPFEIPDSLRSLRLGPLEGTVLGDYLHAVRYFDGAFGEFVGALERSGLLDRSVVVVYGDHVAELGDDDALAALLESHAGLPARRAGFDPRHWAEENKVAFLVHLPGDEAAGVVEASAGHLDISPTVLNLLGIRDHDMPSLGRDVSGGRDSFVVFRNGGFIHADTLCVAPHAALRETRCADLRTDADLRVDRFTHRLDAARQRLSVSDVLVQGDLIPRAEGRPPATRSAHR